MTTTRLKGCPRCAGALDLTQQEPSCFQCGFQDYQPAANGETHENRLTATKRKHARPGSGRGYRLPNRARTGPYGAESLVMVTPSSEDAKVVVYPLCPVCIVRMAPSWTRKVPPGSKGYKCSLGHRVVVYRDKDGVDVSWAWYMVRRPARRGI